MMEQLEENDLMVVMNFINLMANPVMWTSYCLSEDAVLDWFGRSVLGRESIISFIKMHSSRMHHTTDKIKRIPAIKHRLLKRFDNAVVPSKEKEILVTECGQGDCQVTPENKVHPNQEELVKAPRKKLYKIVSNVENWKFLEIRGKLEIGTIDDGVENISEKKFHRIVLGFSDKIHAIIYEAENTCRKKLYMFNM